MTQETRRADKAILNWESLDFEQRLGFRGGKYTDINSWLAFILGLLVTVVFYAVLYALRGTYLANIFIERGITPYFTALLAFWSFAILFIKSAKLKLQQQALSLNVVPDAPDFVLAPATAKDVLAKMNAQVDSAKHFVLLSRIERALSNLQNIGMISDVSEILRSQAENDEDHMESSYAMIRGFIWAIPVLGFIGTVLGLSQAISKFGVVLVANDAMSKLKESLQGVTAGLAVAFDTTLIALVAALIIQLTMTALKKNEERFLDECKEHCHRHIISRLRLIQLREETVKTP